MEKHYSFGVTQTKQDLNISVELILRLELTRFSTFEKLLF